MSMYRSGRSLAPSLSLRGASLAALALAGAAACDEASTNTTIQLNLDRPVDVAFACYGGMRVTNGLPAAASQEVVDTAQPLAACDFRTKPAATDAPVVAPPGQEDLTLMGGAALSPTNYYGLILQAGPGTVALARFPATRASTFDGTDVEILDADPLTPGKNSLVVGVQPVALGVDRSGCYAVTANAGTRDLSVLDVSSALRRDGAARVERRAVTNAGAAVNAAPAAMAVEPGPSLDEAGNILADAAVKVGQTCPAAPMGRAYVAYPSCHAVALVDLADGKIVKAIHFDAAGAASIIDPGAPQWSAQCGGSAAAAAGPEPATLDLRYDLRAGVTLPRRLVIGARNSNRLTVVELDANAAPTAVAQVPLFDATGSLGVLDVALSPRVLMGGDLVAQPTEAPAPRTAEIGAGGAFQFAYAVASDGTVRVASTLPDVFRECDTQLDPRFLRSKTVAEVACLPMASVSQPRRAGANGPGITIPAEGVPSAVNIVRIDELYADVRAKSVTKLVGTFAVITSTTGAAYIADLDDDDKPDLEVAGRPLEVDLATALPHQLRDAVNDRGAVPETTDDNGVVTRQCASAGPGVDETGNTRGGSRLAGTLNVLSLVEVIANAKRGQLPTLQHVACTGSDTGTLTTIGVPELSFGAPTDVREDRFPDTRGMRSVEDWRVVWEGLLSSDNLLTDNDGPAVRLGTMRATGGASPTLSVTDPSRPYCSAGVEPYDIVQLRGCDPQSTSPQCPVGTKCYVHPDSTSGFGSCLPEKTADQLAETCRAFLVTARRYGVVAAKSGELTLVPRPRVLRSTPLEGCTSNAQCAELANYEAKFPEETHPSQSTTTAAQSYACLDDPTRRGAIKRCVMTCTRDADCSAGSVCQVGKCMESVQPPAACVAGLQRYELHAGDAFAVLGSQSGYIHPIIRDASDNCVVNPNANKLQIGRFSLTPPPCGGAGDPNPCLTEVTHVDQGPVYQPGTCTAADPAVALRTRTVPAIRFRGPGMTFHLVHPYYPGDVCRGDQQGPYRATLADTTRPAIPSVFVGFGLSFRTGGGFAPLGLTSTATVPVRVVRGPQQSIWIVDEGDYLSESTSVPSTRGKVFRIEGGSIRTVNVMQ